MKHLVHCMPHVACWWWPWAASLVHSSQSCGLALWCWTRLYSHTCGDRGYQLPHDNQLTFTQDLNQLQNHIKQDIQLVAYMFCCHTQCTNKFSAATYFPTWVPVQQLVEPSRAVSSHIFLPRSLQKFRAFLIWGKFCTLKLVLVRLEYRKDTYFMIYVNMQTYIPDK